MKSLSFQPITVVLVFVIGLLNSQAVNGNPESSARARCSDRRASSLTSYDASAEGSLGASRYRDRATTKARLPELLKLRLERGYGVYCYGTSSDAIATPSNVVPEIFHYWKHGAAATRGPKDSNA